MNMKKGLILILFSLLVVLNKLNAQEQNIRKTNFGIYAGLNGSKLVSDSALQTKMRIGFQFGGFFRYGNNVFIRGDVAKFGMSSSLVDAGDTSLIVNPGLEDLIDIHFIHIPLQLGFKIFHSPDGTSALWIAGGGYLDQIYKVKENQFGLLKSDFKTTSLGIISSAGFDLWFMTFQMTYQRGFTQILKMDEESLKYSLTFSVGIKF